MSAGPFKAEETGFFSAGTWVDRVLAWIQVIRTVGARDLVQVLLQASCGLRFPVQWTLFLARPRGLVPGEQCGYLAGCLLGRCPLVG